MDYSKFSKSLYDKHNSLYDFVICENEEIFFTCSYMGDDTHKQVVIFTTDKRDNLDMYNTLNTWYGDTWK